MDGNIEEEISDKIQQEFSLGCAKFEHSVSHLARQMTS